MGSIDHSGLAKEFVQWQRRNRDEEPGKGKSGMQDKNQGSVRFDKEPTDFEEMIRGISTNGEFEGVLN